MTSVDHMHALYTADQVRRIDRHAIERLPIAAYELMQRAADAAFAVLREHWPDARHIVLLTGPGNNGGDAFLLGLLARRAGMQVEALALPGDAIGDALRARLAFVAAGGRVVEIDAHTPIPSAADICIDGLFGVGLSRPVEGSAAVLIETLNTSGKPVLALDIPSGLDADSGTPRGIAVHAAVTVSFVGWKRGLFTADGADYCGRRRLATLDLPVGAYADSEPDACLLGDSITDFLAPRHSNVNKSSFGHVLLVGGDTGMAGAILLSGMAALRTGAGLVSIATRQQNVTASNAMCAELMTRGVEDAEALGALLERASVIAIGPGLGQTAWGRALFEATLACAKPLVIDADALNILAQCRPVLPPMCVLTPHPGEAARLLGCDSAAVQGDRFAAARELARRHRAMVVLKGSGSLIAHPDGRIAVCPWGNPGMSSGGMGDLLTGVIAALLGQGLYAWDAARLGVALHARAGDAAAAAAPRGLIASDLLAPLRQLANPQLAE